MTPVDGGSRGSGASGKAESERLLVRNEELQGQCRTLQEASHSRAEALARMSHELRTPLNAIIGFAEMMHDAKVGPVTSDQKEFLGDILTSARQILLLIDQGLDSPPAASGTPGGEKR
jgi:signal transduction histidine kinase